MRVVDITFDASYPAGGEAISADDVGLSQVIDTMLPAVAVASSNFLNVAYNPATGKLMAYYPTGGSVAAPTTVAQPVGNTGATAVTSSVATLPIVPGAGKEVGNGADLSAFKVRVIAIGL